MVHTTTHRRLSGEVLFWEHQGRKDPLDERVTLQEDFLGEHGMGLHRWRLGS